MRIWKWSLQATDIQQVQMPRGARLLSVQVQNKQPQLWALVDEREPTEARTIATYSTGNPLPERADYGTYVGTYQLYDGGLVFHVFDQTHSVFQRRGNFHHFELVDKAAAPAP